MEHERSKLGMQAVESRRMKHNGLQVVPIALIAFLIALLLLFIIVKSLEAVEDDGEQQPREASWAWKQWPIPPSRGAPTTDYAPQR